MLTINEINSWSLDKCNEELGAACHYSLHNDVSEAREACVEMAREMGMLPKKQKRIINLNHFGLWGDLRRAAIEAASRQLIVRETGDGHAIEHTGARRDGDGTYAGVEFTGPQSPEIEAILGEHTNRVTDIAPAWQAIEAAQ